MRALPWYPWYSMIRKRRKHVALPAQAHMGEISDPHFAEVMLGTFIGAEPPTPRLKRELLGLHD